MTSYSVKVSMDGMQWKDVRCQRPFAGNSDRDSKAKAMFPEPVRARYVRIYPQTWQSAMSMRAGVILCMLDCKGGMLNYNLIKGSLLSTSDGPVQTPHPACTLHPTPYTLHPTPYTLHPKPFTLHSPPSTLNPNPSALNPQPSTPNPRPGADRPVGPGVLRRRQRLPLQPRGGPAARSGFDLPASFMCSYISRMCSYISCMWSYV